MDARVAGMVYASIEHPPVFGGKVKSYDEKEPLKVRACARSSPSILSNRPPPFSPWVGWP